LYFWITLYMQWKEAHARLVICLQETSLQPLRVPIYI
jgi:hypothetical protein